MRSLFQATPATILVIDDNSANLGVVVDELEQLGHTVLIAQDGEEGIRRAQRVIPDLILLDVIMPRLDGLETCRRLRAHELTTAIPIIFMTSLDSTIDKIEGFRAGAVDYVTKPLEINELAARITTHLNLRKLHLMLEVQNARLHDEVDVRVRAEQDLLQMIEGVRNVSNAIAHDLRTPLAALRSRLEAVLTEKPSSEAMLVEIEGAVSHVDSVMALFNALMRLAQIDAGLQRSGFVQVDLEANVLDAVEFYLPVAEQRGTKLVVETSTAVFVQGDPSLLSQAVGNLIDNAIKFSPSDTTITIALRKLPFDRVGIAVKDSGPGIRDADKSRVVERFFRGDKSRATPGAGLGLAMVACVAQLHRGELQLTDNCPGLCAVLVLPSIASVHGA